MQSDSKSGKKTSGTLWRCKRKTINESKNHKSIVLFVGMSTLMWFCCLNLQEEAAHVVTDRNTPLHEHTDYNATSSLVFFIFTFQNKVTLNSRPPVSSLPSRVVLQLVAEEVAVVGLQVDFYRKVIAHLKSLWCHKGHKRY